MGEQLKNLKCVKNALSLGFSEQSILSFTDSCDNNCRSSSPTRAGEKYLFRTLFTEMFRHNVPGLVLCQRFRKMFFQIHYYSIVS